MSAPAALADPAAPARRAEALRVVAGGGSATLEQRILAAWHSLAETGRADCPLCDGRLAGADGGEARCDSCGARLT